jgi:hypothetical protein
MHYDSLDILPIKLYYKISETNNLKLLSDIITDEVELQKLWFDLDIGFKDLDKTEEATKTFRLSKSIGVLEGKHKVVLMACTSLRFDFEQSLIDLLKKEGITIRDTNTETYYNDIEKAERETNALVVKCNMIRRQLPKNDGESSKSSLDEVMASYATILGFDFDFNTISCTKFFALQSQVNNKVKAMERQVEKIKSNSKR